jgi:hypothetical protein
MKTPEPVMPIRISTCAPARHDDESEPTSDAALSREAAAPAGTPTPDLPADIGAHRAAERVLRGIVEILDGRRSVDQLDGLATPAVMRCVKSARHRVHGARLISVRAIQPHEKAIEAAAVCRSTRGVHAIAARFEHTRRRGWRCTVFRLI